MQQRQIHVPAIPMGQDGLLRASQATFPLKAPYAAPSRQRLSRAHSQERGPLAQSFDFSLRTTASQLNRISQHEATHIPTLYQTPSQPHVAKPLQVAATQAMAGQSVLVQPTPQVYANAGLKPVGYLAGSLPASQPIYPRSSSLSHTTLPPPSQSTPIL